MLTGPPLVTVAAPASLGASLLRTAGACGVCCYTVKLIGITRDRLDVRVHTGIEIRDGDVGDFVARLRVRMGIVTACKVIASGGMYMKLGSGVAACCPGDPGHEHWRIEHR